MSKDGNIPEDRRADDVIAGEYVLGVLSEGDRRKVEARLKVDARFAARVRDWESNLSSFNDDYLEETPPPRVLKSIEARLFASAAPVQSGGLWASLAFWRGLAFAGVVAASVLGIQVSGLLQPKPVPGKPLIAELAAENSAISLVALYDSQSGHLKLTPAASGAAEQKSLELWLIDGDNPAVSLGVLPASGNGEIEISPDMREKFGEGTVLAVSLEPFGGSPTGKATGPVIAVGKARNL